MAFAVNKESGAMIVGRLERLLATAQIVEDSWAFDGPAAKTGPKDGFHFEWDGHTDVDWDSQDAELDQHGEPIYMDALGNEVRPDDIEITDDPEGYFNEFMARKEAALLAVAQEL